MRQQEYRVQIAIPSITYHREHEIGGEHNTTLLDIHTQKDLLIKMYDKILEDGYDINNIVIVNKFSYFIDDVGYDQKVIFQLNSTIFFND